MKNRLKTILKVALLIVVVIWVVDKIPFSKQIVQDVPASLYRDGVAVEQTMVRIDGEKTRYLLRQSEEYWGKFQIPVCEITTQEDVNAGIDWNEDNHMQDIRFMAPGSFLDTDVMYFILMSDDMTKFAFMFRDGTVLATSEELHQLYSKHFSTNGAGGMSIQDVEGIPKIQ